jgi:hypothetical protein
MSWLKEQFDQAETEEREHLQRELARADAEHDGEGEPRWQVAIRLYSPAQSIRSAAIKSWNDRATWIKISAVHNDKQAVEAEFTFGDYMRLQELGLGGYRAAHLFVAAMNIGSTGFWWWERPEQHRRYYQRISDLKTPESVRLDLNIYPGAKFEWKRDALKEGHLTRVAVCLGMAARLDRAAYFAIIENYITALALFAKSDLHFSLAPQACERFATSMLEAMRHFGDWDGTDEGIAAAVAARLPFQKPDYGEEIVALLRQLRRQPINLAPLTLERAAILKFVCDAYLIGRFEAMATDTMPRGGNPDSAAGGEP